MDNITDTYTDSVGRSSLRHMLSSESKKGGERNQVLNDVDLDKLVLYDSPDV